jgi:hypothetical protein
MSATAAEPGSAMCTLCGYARPMDANVSRVEGVTSATEFALHFVLAHPEVKRPVSRYVVIAPTDSEPHVSGATD